MRNWIMVLLLMFIVVLFTQGRAEAGEAEYRSWGEAASIKCWSGDTLIYEGASAGKVFSEMYSDGYYFVDKATKKPMEVIGNCVFRFVS